MGAVIESGALQLQQNRAYVWMRSAAPIEEIVAPNDIGDVVSDEIEGVVVNKDDHA